MLLFLQLKLRILHRRNIVISLEIKRYACSIILFRIGKYDLFEFQPIVQWKMRLPEKKPLVLADRQNDSNAHVKPSTTKKRLEPLRVLSEFHNS